MWYFPEVLCKNRSLCLSVGEVSSLRCMQKPMSVFQLASLYFLVFFQFILTRKYFSFLCKKTSRLISLENRGVSLVIADSVYILQAFNCLFVLETCSKLICLHRNVILIALVLILSDFLPFWSKRMKTQWSNNRKEKQN